MKTEFIVYKDEDVSLQGFVAYPNKKEHVPVILIAHDWSGRNEFAMHKAQWVASLGYIGFALDMYGDANVYETKEEKSAMITPFVNDRSKLYNRINAALTAVKKLPEIDKQKIGAMGFCFGGMCVLDLARQNKEIQAVVSVHGLLNPSSLPAKTIHAKILALHGHDDPMVTPEHVLAFEKEMSQAKADWQVHVYGGTQHAFTNPHAHDHTLGTVYDARAERRALQSIENFFGEVLL